MKVYTGLVLFFVYLAWSNRLKFGSHPHSFPVIYASFWPIKHVPYPILSV